MFKEWGTDLKKCLNNRKKHSFIAYCSISSRETSGMNAQFRMIHKKLGVRFLNVLPPHSSRDQKQDEICAQEGVCP